MDLFPPTRPFYDLEFKSVEENRLKEALQYISSKLQASPEKKSLFTSEELPVDLEPQLMRRVKQQGWVMQRVEVPMEGRGTLEIVWSIQGDPMVWAPGRRKVFKGLADIDEFLS